MRCNGAVAPGVPDMTGYARGDMAAADYPGAAAAAERYRRDARHSALAHKDYTVPLHVDCSIEYELPDCAKPPQGVKVEPLLMIHPAHFRRLESLRRVPFVNNLPRCEAAAVPARAPRSARPAPRRCCRAAPAPVAPAPALPAAAEYRLLFDDLLQERAAPAAPAAPADYGATAYRLEYPELAYEGELAACGYKSKAARRPRQPAHAAHPYLAPEPGAGLDCDIQGSASAAYERFDKRQTLPQLPIYM